MIDRKYRGHGLQFHLFLRPVRLSVQVDDSTRFLVELTNSYRSKIYVPHSVVDFLETDRFLRKHGRDVDRLAAPSNATAVGNAANDELTGILDLGEPVEVGPR